MVARTTTGKELAREAFDADVTGVALAKKLGIHRSTLSSYHNGWRVPPEGWADFARKYRAAVKELSRERAAADRRTRTAS